MNASNNTMISLFSGCGGFDLGFEQEGFRSIAAYDIDKTAVHTFNRNVRNSAKICDLATDTPHGNPAVLLAGSPCQGFSTAGKRELDDPRNNLLLRAGQIALKMRPKVFVLENVPAAISGRHGSRWEQVEHWLAEAGYQVERIFAEGPQSGVPQLRKRLFMLAWKGSHRPECNLPPVEAPTVKEALQGIGSTNGHDPGALVFGSRDHSIARRIGPGQKLSNVRISPAAVHTWQIPTIFGKTSKDEREALTAIVRLRRRERRRDYGDADPVEPSKLCDHLGRCCQRDIDRLIDIGYLRRVGDYVDLKHTYNGKYRRLSLDQPSPTVDTHFGNPRLFLHPCEHRGLTPREAARIQGFDDDFDFGPSRNKAFRMIGNAVAPPMARRLARFIREALIPGVA